MPASTDSRHHGSPEQRMRGSLRGVVVSAVSEATSRGAGAVEAEHLLLALLHDRRNAAAVALAAAGLDYEAFSTALFAERDHSLRAAGVDPIPPERLVSTGRRDRPRWGTSAKQALGAGLHAAGGQRARSMRHTDVAVGVLSSSLGTVPRALAHAGFDRSELLKALVSATQEA